MGVFIALLIMVSWLSHLIYILLFQEISVSNIMCWVHLIIQTWLFTGLFITAHDSMHGTISRNKGVNYFLGFLATLMYAGMWYPALLKKHKLHHIYSATSGDPDYYTGTQNFFAWWFAFMKQYLTIWQLLIMAALFNIGLLFFTELQLIVLWVLPAILSTFQLFYFGTYIPHRLPHNADMLPHNSRTQKRNHLWAMISCYFFGYHFEHHASPATPWWKLYRIKDAGLKK